MSKYTKLFHDQKKIRRLESNFYDLFFYKQDRLKRWVVLLTITIPIVFTIWGIKVSYWSVEVSKEIASNREQIDTLISLTKNSRNQIELLQKIFVATDSTNKSTTNLKDLPNKILHLSSTLDTLNLVLENETKKLSASYSSLNMNNDILIKQQKNSLDFYKQISSSYSRKANLAVFASIENRIMSGSIVSKISIINTGNIEAKITSILLELSHSDIPSLDKSSQFEIVNRLEGKINLKQEVKNLLIVSAGSTCQLELGLYSTRHSGFEIKYSLSYVNSNESKTVSGIAVIR